MQADKKEKEESKSEYSNLTLLFLGIFLTLVQKLKKGESNSLRRRKRFFGEKFTLLVSFVPDLCVKHAQRPSRRRASHCTRCSQKSKTKQPKSQAKQRARSPKARRSGEESERAALRTEAGQEGGASASWSRLSTGRSFWRRAQVDREALEGGAREKSVHVGRLSDQRHPGERRPSEEAPQRRHDPKCPPPLGATLGPTCLGSQ